MGIRIILTFDDTEGGVNDSDLNDSDGAVHGDAATAAVDDDNDDGGSWQPSSSSPNGHWGCPSHLIW